MITLGERSRRGWKFLATFAEPFDLCCWPCAVDSTIDLMRRLVEAHGDHGDLVRRRSIVDLHTFRTDERSYVSNLFEGRCIVVGRHFASVDAFVVQLERLDEEVEFAAVLFANDGPCGKRGKLPVVT